MEIWIDQVKYEFEQVELKVVKRDIRNIFYNKNNKTVDETFESPRYQRLGKVLRKKYCEFLNQNLGDFLKDLKENNDLDYLCFLNKYGDSPFCDFRINNKYLNDKGLYCFQVNRVIKYVGRCSDNFKKRINQGYGNIHPKNCFIDGQATNCHINTLVNSMTDVKFGVYVMNECSTKEIAELEKLILTCNRFEWNVQRK